MISFKFMEPPVILRRIKCGRSFSSRKSGSRKEKNF